MADIIQLEQQKEFPVGGIGEIEVRTAYTTLKEYQAGRSNYDQKIKSNNEWWRKRHWENFKGGKEHKDSSTSGWMFNSMAGKHADFMDSFPEATCLPREKQDEATAATLQAIIPCIMEHCNFEKTYSDNTWEKLKNGAAVYEVVWNGDLNYGAGDIDIKPMDILSIYWEPGIDDIQASKNIFTIQLADNDSLVNQYPELEGKLSGTTLYKVEYEHDDHIDTSKKSAVIDWYYKVRKGNRDIVHYVKMVNENILFSTENMPEEYPDGLYDHGQYPFIIDTLYPVKDTPVGFGLIDLMKSDQEYIDRIDDSILHNTEEATRRRYLVKDNCGINEEELTDINKRIIHCAGSPNDDNFRALEVPTLSTAYLDVLTTKIDGLKETSGNRDFSQGSTASGVTAASAIAALQEAGSKLSRDMIAASYRTYTEICHIVIELIRQFYSMERTFRITGENGSPEFIQFDNSGMQEQAFTIAEQIFHKAEPIFDIKVKAHKKNPYAVISQNELALQFYNSGFFNPQLVDQVLPCVDMMEFEGKEKVKETIQKNGTMFEQLQQLKQLLALSAQALAENGDTRVLQALNSSGLLQPKGNAAVPEGGGTQVLEADSLGKAIPNGNTAGEKARRGAAKATEVKA